MPRYSAAMQRYSDRPPLQPGAGVAGEAGSLEQGVWVRFGMDVQGGQLRQVGFRAFACPHIIAACQRVSEQLEGAPVDALRGISLQDLQQEFDIPVNKAGKLLILKDALIACSEHIAGRDE